MFQGVSAQWISLAIHVSGLIASANLILPQFTSDLVGGVFMNLICSVWYFTPFPTTFENIATEFGEFIELEIGVASHEICFNTHAYA